MSAILRTYIEALRRHPGCAAFLSTLTAFLAVDAIRRHALGKTAVYGAAIGLSVLAIDAVLARWPVSNKPLPVRSPRLEVLVASSTAAIGFGCLWLLFVMHFRPTSFLPKLLLVGLGLGSVFGVTLALFLLARGYRPSELGVRIRGLFLALPVIAVFGVLAFAFNRGSVLSAFASPGAFAGSLAGMPAAALSEEFLRVVWQTRVAAWRANSTVGWIVASCVWAAMHGPRLWGAVGALHGTLGIIEFIPFGLLLGYLTHRTKSFLPAVLIHAANIWGLQDV